LGAEGNWKNGEQDGLWRAWHENGQFMYRKIWKDGKLLQ